MILILLPMAAIFALAGHYTIAGFCLGLIIFGTVYQDEGKR